MISEPRVEERAVQPYVAVRTRVPMPDWGHLLPGLWGQVYGWLDRQGVKPAGPPLIRYRVIDMMTELEIDVGVPVAPALAGDDRITADALPAGRYYLRVEHYANSSEIASYFLDVRVGR